MLVLCKLKVERLDIYRKIALIGPKKLQKCLDDMRIGVHNIKNEGQRWLKQRIEVYIMKMSGHRRGIILYMSILFFAIIFCGKRGAGL